MSDPITVVPYDPAWPEIFGQLGARMRAALGGVALRIDHIGSTAVPGLAAKPIVDDTDQRVRRALGADGPAGVPGLGADLGTTPP